MSVETKVGLMAAEMVYMMENKKAAWMVEQMAESMDG